MGIGSRLEQFFEERTDDALRSVVKYTEEGFELIYLRDDVADQYTEQELRKAVDDSRMESLSAPIYEKTFSANHGDLTCLAKCFDNVIEMNFVIEDGRGAAVALDGAAMENAHGLVAEAREIVLEERG